MKKKIAEHISKAYLYGERTVADDESLFEGGVIDSLGFIGLLSFLEQTFGIRIEMSEITMDKFDTLNSIVAVVADKLKQAGGDAGA